MLDRPSDRRARQRRRVAEQRRARQARYRRRLQKHEAVATGIVYGEKVLDFLVRTRWLDERAVNDRDAISRAISELLRDMAEAG
jgi:hypothetical protein